MQFPELPPLYNVYLPSGDDDDNDEFYISAK